LFYFRNKHALLVESLDFSTILGALMKMLGLRLRWLYAFLLSVIVFSGCAANRYEAPIGTFRDRTQQTINVLSSFYSSRNSYEINLYLEGIAADSGLAVQTTDSSGIPTPLGKPIFSPVGIKARLDALNLIGLYASRLYDLANSTAPAKFQSGATALGQNLSSLDKTFQTLQGASDPTANKYIGPIGSLLGTVGEMFLDRKRDELITKAVTDGAPRVETLLSQIRDDMDNIFSLEIITGSNEKLATLIAAYNVDRTKLDFEQRMARLSEIKAAANEVAASVGSAPSGLVTSMMDAHKALVQEALSPPKSRISNLAALNGSLEQWATQIQTLSTEMKTLMH
jgi:hypothetical protein